jgi:PhzF family phenazine biosynthesis protein
VHIRIIDAFTDRPFAGNPAAVCLLDADAWADELWMRHVAAEMTLPETAFAHPLPECVDADWALRWFTPAVEVDLCETPLSPPHMHLTGHAITVLDGLHHTAG